MKKISGPRPRAGRAVGNAIFFAVAIAGGASDVYREPIIRPSPGSQEGTE